jgi:hypothetical protein
MEAVVAEGVRWLTNKILIIRAGCMATLEHVLWIGAMSLWANFAMTEFSEVRYSKKFPTNNKSTQLGGCAYGR